jgi:hypothetical protein
MEQAAPGIGPYLMRSKNELAFEAPKRLKFKLYAARAQGVGKF